jgi:hypothetical protein
LFASGHLQPAVDNFTNNGSTGVFRGPLPSSGYRLYWIGKSLATRDNRTFGLGLHTVTGQLLPRLRRGANVDPMVALRYE